MKKLDVGQTIQMLANVGVLAGIVFLALEIRQNSYAVQAQSRAQIASDAADHLMRIAENPQITEIYIRANDGEELSEVEQWQLLYWLQSRVRRWENIHYQYRQGLYSEEDYVGNRTAWRGALSSQSARQHWEQNRDSFSPEFAAEIDRLLAGPQ